MIDVILINFNSYFLLHQQMRHWLDYMKGDFNLIVVDNTPDHLYKPFYGIGGEPIPRVPETYAGMFDGISSGLAYDYALSLCTSEVVGMVDPDAFWLDPYMIPKIEDWFKSGYKAIGAQGWYLDWVNIIDQNYLNFRGHLAPALWMQFMTRELATSHTFVCLPPGVGKITGWEVRQKIIDERLLNMVFPGFNNPIDNDHDICYFGFDKDKPLGVHFLKGSGGRSHVMQSRVPPVLEREKAKWA